MLPITFQPLYQERVWGGRNLETLYQRQLPNTDSLYGESWELSDREEAQSIVLRGEHAGKSLHQLWTTHRAEIFGEFQSKHFPLLIKILDAQKDLSIQVHPPTEQAHTLGGEPKTEMWYIAHAVPGAKIYVGLKKNTSKAAFETALQNGDPDQLVHTIEPIAGQSIHIPSGRLHAIGAGLVIYEIQQNSDTTYRVFDWNRPGLDGKPRDLHIKESIQCIDFNDFEPSMDQPNDNILAECPYYKVEHHTLEPETSLSNPNPEAFSVVIIINGTLKDNLGNSYSIGDFLLLPKGATPLLASTQTEILQVTLPAHS